jgi:D-inositol-3-phosphate glycosyltransferase
MIAHVMTSVSRGGLELYVLELIEQLHKAGMAQVVVCDSHAFMTQSLKALGIPFEYIAPGSRYSLRRMMTLRSIHQKFSVTVWHSHQRDDMILVALAFYFSKIRHLFSLYMGFARKKDLLHRLIYRRLEKLITTSRLMNAQAIEKLPVKPEQVACIRYGRDKKLFRLDPAVVKSIRKKLGIAASQKIVISLCRLDPMKGVREFAEAARLVTNQKKGRFLFVQIGERTIMNFDSEGLPVYLPESEDVYRQLVAAERGAQSTSRYTLLPFQKDFVPYLLAADYFVLGSYDEMYSLSMVDAMMAGCLVIGTNNGGTVEQLEGGRGFLVESKSARAIAEAILKAEVNPAASLKMRKASQAWALKEHTWNAVWPQWLQLYGLQLRK